MEISHDSKGNKIIKIPPVFPETNPIKYKHLHQKSLLEFEEENDLSGIRVENSLPMEFYPDTKYLVIEYKDTLKPNERFKCSKPLSDLLKDEIDMDYMVKCQFFYWEDAIGEKFIRFTRPYIDFDEEVSLID